MPLLAPQVYGINLTSVVDDVTSIPQINQTLAYFSSPVGIAALQSASDAISAANVTSLQQASGDFSQINGVSLLAPYMVYGRQLRSRLPFLRLQSSSACLFHKHTGAQQLEPGHSLMRVALSKR